uniref:Uncharacterized protein n=1 Tax=Pyrodinium bahamense TaxID=73915 RepID=A0A7S0ABI3_9DINO
MAGYQIAQMLCLLALAVVSVVGAAASGAAVATRFEPGASLNACSTGDDAALLQVPAVVTGQRVGGQLGAQHQNDDPTCARIVYHAKYVLPKNAAHVGMSPPMAVGTAENMDPQLPMLGLDFSGLWWMRGDPVPAQLVSFAHATVNSSAFPAQLLWPSSRSGAWSWSDDAVGWGLVAYYAMVDPAEPLRVNFVNATYGSIETGLTAVPLIWVDLWPFVKLSEDEWLRPATARSAPADGSSDEPLLPETNYTLTRVVTADGQPHPVFWDKFMEHMTMAPQYDSPEKGGDQMISWSTDDPCLRKCQVVMTCHLCKDLCR